MPEIPEYLLRNTLWDFCLGLLPVILAPFVAHVATLKSPARWLALPLFVVWLVLLPNAAYLITEFRHAPLRAKGLLEADSTAGEVRSFLFWLGYYVIFSGSGLLLFTLAVRPLVRLPGKRRWISWILLPFFCVVAALGVYLGLRLRFNSWDLLSRPGEILGAARQALDRRGTVLPLLFLLSAFLWVTYHATEIWIEGFAHRMERMRSRSAGGRARTGAAR